MYRRPPTYLIIASKIVRPASIYQVDLCVDGDDSDDDKRTNRKLELLIIALKKCTFKQALRYRIWDLGLGSKARYKGKIWAFWTKSGLFGTILGPFRDFMSLFS